MSEYKLKTPKNMEEIVVGIYKKIENSTVGAYYKIEDKFVDTFLEKADDPAGESDSAAPTLKKRKTQTKL